MRNTSSIWTCLVSVFASLFVSAFSQQNAYSQQGAGTVHKGLTVPIIRGRSVDFTALAAQQRLFPTPNVPGVRPLRLVPVEFNKKSSIASMSFIPGAGKKSISKQAFGPCTSADPVLSTFAAQVPFDPVFEEPPDTMGAVG